MLSHAQGLCGNIQSRQKLPAELWKVLANSEQTSWSSWTSSWRFSFLEEWQEPHDTAGRSEKASAWGVQGVAWISL